MSEAQSTFVYICIFCGMVNYEIRMKPDEASNGNGATSDLLGRLSCALWQALSVDQDRLNRGTCRKEKGEEKICCLMARVL